MDSDEAMVRMAEEEAGRLEGLKGSLPDDGEGSGLYEIEVPRQSVWLFHRDVAMRALGVLKMIGLRGRFKGKAMR